MAWGKSSDSKSDFNLLCDKIEKNQTLSDSVTILRSKFGTIWLSHECPSKLAKAFSKNKSVREFICTGLDFTKEACAILAKSLKSNTTLKVLFLGHENFGDEQLIELLKYDTLGSIEVLDLERRSLSDLSGKFLGKTIGMSSTHIVSLNIAENCLGDNGIMMLANGISSYTCLRDLNLKNNEITSKGVMTLANALISSSYSNLNRLNLSGNLLGIEGVASLSQVECSELFLDGCHGEDVGCAVLSLGKSRKVLSLCENDLTEGGAKLIAEYVFLNGKDDGLHSLRLAKNIKIGNPGVQAIAQILEKRNQYFPQATSIKTIDLSNTNASQLPFQFLSGSIDTLIFVGNGPLDHVDVAQTLCMSSGIKTLSLSGTGITNMIPIFESLHSHPTLTTIELGGIPLTEQARNALEILREKNPTLDIAVDKGEHNDPK